MGKVAKQTKKFQKNNLPRVIKERRKTKQVKARFEKRRGNKGGSKSTEASQGERPKRKETFGYQDVVGDEDELLKTDLLSIMDKSEYSDLDEELEASEGSDVSLEDLDDQNLDADEPMSEEKANDEQNINDAVADHKLELEALKEQDPEFYKYIKDNDKNLLNFDLSDEEEEENDDLAVDECGSDSEDSGGKKELTSSIIEDWEKTIQKNHTIGVIQAMIYAFHDGAHIGDQSEGLVQHSKYRINDDRVFNKLMITTLKTIPGALDFHLRDKKDPKKQLSKSPQWKRLRPIVKLFLSSVVHMYSVCSTSDMHRYLLENTHGLLELVVCCVAAPRNFIKALSASFSQSLSTEIQTLSFSLIRKLCILSPDLLDICLKSIYTSFIRNCRLMTSENMIRISVMRSCAVELFGHNFDKSYQFAFSCIRQLAVQLRNAITNKTKEYVTKVYNWQFIQTLHLWTNVLSTYCDRSIVEEHGPSPLQPLLYPLIQIVLGVIGLVPTPSYFPLRFHCLRSLTALAQKTNTYIPLTPYLIEVLESIEFQRPPKPCTLKPFNIQLTLKTPKIYLRTRIFQDMLAEELNEILLGYFCSISRSIAFPEITIPITIYLRRFTKNSKAVKTNKMLEQAMAKVKLTADLIQSKRQASDFAPSSIEKMSAFLPCEAGVETPIEQYYASVMAVRKQRQTIMDSADA